MSDIDIDNSESSEGEEQNNNLKTSKRITKYKKSWEDTISWIRPAKDVSYAVCILCNKKKIKIAYGGLSSITRHSLTKTHKEKEKLFSSKSQMKLAISKHTSLVGIQSTLGMFFFVVWKLKIQVLNLLCS